MAISIDFPTKVISVPQADCTLVSGSLYRLPTKTVFRAQVIALTAAEEGVVFPPAIDHNADYTVFGVTYAPKVEVINGYSVTFTPDTAWSVLLEESNNNIADIEAGILNPNNVTVVPNNSGGLIVTTTGSGLSAAQDTKLTEIHGEVREIEGVRHLKEMVRLIFSVTCGKLLGAVRDQPGTVRFRSMADDKDRVTATVDEHGNRNSVSWDDT